jgi:hypothetical protein
MSSVSHFVGMDYHQSFVQMCIMDSNGKVLSNRRCENSVLHLVALSRAGRRGHRSLLRLR